MKDETVSSTSDVRVINNVMRHEYRVLTDTEKAQMQHIKDMGLSFIVVLHNIGVTNPTGDRFATRELSLAATNMEQAVMWAVKHLTR